MNDTLNDARESVRNATRASLLAMRSMVDARIRRVEQKQAAMRSRGDASAREDSEHARERDDERHSRDDV